MGNDVNKELAVASAAGWKFWYSAARREAAHARLTEHCFARPESLLAAAANRSHGSQVRALARQVLIKSAKEETVLRGLIQCAARTPHLLQKLEAAEIFEKLGPTAAAAGPLLCAWVSGKQLHEVIKITGDATVDRALMEVAKASTSALEFQAAEEFVLAELRCSAARALGEFGRLAIPALPFLRKGLALEIQQWRRRTFERVIEQLERFR